MIPLRRSLLICLAVFLTASLSSFAQSDLDAKAAMIDGLEAYRAGSPTADSLLALGIGHSELAPVAEYNLGRSLVQSGDTARAEAAFRKAIGSSEDPALRSSAWHNLGNLSLQQQSLEPAIQAYKQALREDPTNAAARYNLAYAMRLAQQQQQQDQQQSSEQQEQESDEEQEGQDGDQEQESQDGDQEQDGQDGDQEQEGQDGDQEQDDQDGDQEQEGQDGDQEQEGQDGDQEQEGQDGDQEQEGQDGDQEQEGQQEQQAPSEPVEGQISPEDMERILESLERNEAAIQAKLQRQRGQGTPRKIEKDW